MRPFHVLSAVPLVVFAALASEPTVDRHVAALKVAESVEIIFTETAVGGETNEIRLSLAKPNFLRVESSGRLTVSDGKTLWHYDQAKNAYRKSDVSAEALAKAMQSDRLIAWSAFFDSGFAEKIVSASKGAARTVRGKKVQDVTIDLKDGRNFTVSFDNETGVAFGAKFTRETRGTKLDTIILGKELTIGKADASKFAFAIPADAKDEAEIAAAGGPVLKYADIKSIIDQNCVGCHSGSQPKGRINMAGFDGVANLVNPGDADNSRLIRVIRSGKMPPGGKLPAQSMDSLAKWINDGAQN